MIPGSRTDFFNEPAVAARPPGAMSETIPEDIRRFILTSILSVPHLEALLLLRGENQAPWNSARAAQRLYVSDRTAEQLLADLCAAGFLVVSGQENPQYRYQPTNEELGRMVDHVAAIYARHIIDVTNLIHSKTGKLARQFADAFKLRKD